MILCAACGTNSATQRVRLDFGRDYPWSIWCEFCIDREIEHMTKDYVNGVWTIERFEEEVGFFLTGRH